VLRLDFSILEARVSQNANTGHFEVFRSEPAFMQVKID
jgi:hypothetical protein